MNDEPELELFDMTMDWKDETVADIRVSSLGGNRYRIECDPMPCLLLESARDYAGFPRWGDVVEARKTGPRTVEFVTVVERLRMRRFQWVISQEIIDSPDLDRVLSNVMDLGGYWERIFEGVLIVYLPRKCKYDLWADLRRRL